MTMRVLCGALFRKAALVAGEVDATTKG